MNIGLTISKGPVIWLIRQQYANTLAIASVEASDAKMNGYLSVCLYDFLAYSNPKKMLNVVFTCKVGQTDHTHFLCFLYFIIVCTFPEQLP